MPYSAQGRVRIVQAGDVQPDGRLAAEADYKRIDAHDLLSAAFLEPNDVLLVSRSGPGGGFRAAAFQGRLSSPCLATSAITIIRPASPDIDSGYLAAYLNSGQGQAALQRIASGSSIRTLHLKELSEIPVPIPSPQIQQLTVLIARNVLQQKDLAKRKNQLLDDLLSAITKAK